MYSLEGLDTAKEITEYTIKAMQEKRLGNTEIQMFKRSIKYCDFSTLQQEAQDYIDMLNNMSNQAECKITYTGNI